MMFIDGNPDSLKTHNVFFFFFFVYWVFKNIGSSQMYIHLLYECEFSVSFRAIQKPPYNLPYN